MKLSHQLERSSENVNQSDQGSNERIVIREIRSIF